MRLLTTAGIKLLFKTKRLQSFRILQEISFTCSIRRPCSSTNLNQLTWNHILGNDPTLQGSCWESIIQSRRWHDGVRAEHLPPELTASRLGPPELITCLFFSLYLFIYLFYLGGQHGDAYKAWVEGLFLPRKPSSIRPIGSDATNWCCLTERISGKQLMQQSRKSCLFPFTATRCKMLREARGRSEGLALNSACVREPWAEGPPRPVVTSDPCVLIQRTLILAAVAGCWPPSLYHTSA